MDYKDYVKLVIRNNELRERTFDKDISKEKLIKELKKISYEKKEIQGKCDRIIQEYLEKYEASPESLDDSNAQKLDEMFHSLMIPNSSMFFDAPISLRIGKILITYYKRINDLEKLIEVISFTIACELQMNEHNGNDEEKYEVARMLEEYLPYRNQLSDYGKLMLIKGYFRTITIIVTIPDLLRYIHEVMQLIEQEKEFVEKNLPKAYFYVLWLNLISVANEIFRQEDEKQSRKISPTEYIASEEDRRILLQMCSELYENTSVLGEIGLDRVCSYCYCQQLRFHMGEISYDELMDNFLKLTEIKEDYNRLEQASTVFQVNCYYLTYLYLYSGLSKEEMTNQALAITTEVLGKAKNMLINNNDFMINQYLLMFINAASRMIDFYTFKNFIVELTIYADKALYVHTMMVRELSQILVRYFLQYDPSFMNGVSGYSTSYIEKNQKKFVELIGDCALMHDIGKYFCFEVISTTWRKLTEDEMKAIWEHPTNFNKVYQGDGDAEFMCIRDCALMHHIWHNGKGGYPKQKQTINRPFADIISIADSIDAAMDSIGRPYREGKTLEMLIDEFEIMRDTRYSGKVIDALRNPEVYKEIQYVLEEKQQDFYYEIYTK